jgi:chemotaxis protein CheX
MPANELVGIVERLWQTTLKLPLRHLPDAGVLFTEGTETLTASIRFGGSFPALLSMTCSASLAQCIAAAMFQVRADRATSRDVHDALGEVINILGGNLKAVLSPSCQLSLPAVADGDVAPQALVGANVRVLSELAFETLGERFVLRLLKVPE